MKWKKKRVTSVVRSDSSSPLPAVLSVWGISGVFPIYVQRMAAVCFWSFILHWCCLLDLYCWPLTSPSAATQNKMHWKPSELWIQNGNFSDTWLFWFRHWSWRTIRLSADGLQNISARILSQMVLYCHRTAILHPLSLPSFRRSYSCCCFWL